MPAGEPKAWTLARTQRLAQQFPEFGSSDARTILGVDGMRTQRGEPPTGFSMTAMRLAARAAQERKQL